MRISDAEGTFGSGSDRPGQDPVTGFFLAMRDAWLAGAALSENLAAPSMASGNPEATAPAAGLLAPVIGGLGKMAHFAATNRQRFDQPGAGPAAKASPPGQNQ